MDLWYIEEQALHDLREVNMFYKASAANILQEILNVQNCKQRQVLTGL